MLVIIIHASNCACALVIKEIDVMVSQVMEVERVRENEGSVERTDLCGLVWFRHRCRPGKQWGGEGEWRG